MSPLLPGHDTHHLLLMHLFTCGTIQNSRQQRSQPVAAPVQTGLKHAAAIEIQNKKTFTKANDMMQ